MGKHASGLTFGQLVRAAREVHAWSRSDLGVLLGNLGTGDSPRTFGDSKIQRLENDQLRYLNPGLVRRLIEVLELEPEAAWRAAYPEVAEAVLTAVGGPRPARAARVAGAGDGPASDLGRAPSR